MLEASPLDDGWHLRHEGKPFPAVVPGCVHTDLLAAGVIPDPFIGLGEKEVAWVGWREWTYERELPAGPSGHEQTDLVFDGLDTVAEITLNGQPLGRVRNMHRSYRFDVTGLEGRWRSGSSRPTPRRRPCAARSVTVRPPTPSRTSTSARWRARSAGTGGPPW